MSHIYSRHTRIHLHIKQMQKNHNAIHGILWEVRTQSRQYVQLIISHRIALPLAYTKQTWQRNLWCPFGEENVLKCCIRCALCMLFVPFVWFFSCLCESTTGYMLLLSISRCNRKKRLPVCLLLSLYTMVKYWSDAVPLQWWPRFGWWGEIFPIMNLNTFFTQL